MSFNAFGLDRIQVFSETLIALAMDKGIACVIITGEGRAFCSGADLKLVASYNKSYGETSHELAARYHQAILEIRRMPKPVIAAINGIAAGGGFSIALACDFRVMESSAVLRQAYTTNGLSIDGGGTFSLPRLVGLARAMEIMAFDRPISSSQALSWGLVTEVVEDGQSLNKAVELAMEMKRVPLTSFAACTAALIAARSKAVSTPSLRAFSSICAVLSQLVSSFTSTVFSGTTFFSSLFLSFMVSTPSCYKIASRFYMMVHFVKSISLPHSEQVCFWLNSSEKISFSSPQLGHLQVKAFRCLKSSNPGQCWGVVMSFPCFSVAVFPVVSFCTRGTPR